jgi:WD40 repeat protein/uncharacterized caspase-like protein
MYKKFSIKAILAFAIIGYLLLPGASSRAQRRQPQKPLPKQPAQTVEKPELVIQSGHSDTVRAIAFSPNGKTVASASSDKTIRMWEVETGRLLRVLDIHRDNVTSIAFSPDGKTIASGSLDKTVALCDVKSGRLIRSLVDHSDDVNSVAFSPDGKTIASGSRDETINLWDAATGEVIHTIEGPASEVRAVTFSPDGQILASGSADKVVRLWQVSDGQMIRALAGHTSGVRTVTFSPDGQILASGGDDKMVRLWQVGDGQMIRALAGHSGIVTSTVFSRDGRLLYSGSHDKTIRVWDTQSGKVTSTIEGASDPITSVALSADGSTLAAGSLVKMLLWRSGDGRWVRNFQGRISAVRSVAFSPDGKQLASATLNSIKLWDSGSGVLIQTLDGHASQVNAVAFGANGKVLASASADKTIKLWDLTTGKPFRTITGHVSNVTAIAFSPDGKLIASGSIDRTVRLWDTQSGKQLQIFEGHHSLISAVDFAPDGKSIASGGYDNAVKLWDTQSGKAVYTLTGHASEVTDVAFSPDGRMLASSSRDKTIKLWDTQTGQPIRDIQGHAADVFSVAFSPDGKQLASGSYDKTLRLWEVGTGKAIRTLEGHSGPAVAVAFSADGRFLVSGSEDATAKIWLSATGQPLCTLLSFNDGGEWLVITPEGLFDGSPEGWKSILWRFAANTFDIAPVEAFFNEFYYPGLLAEVLAVKNPRAAQNISRVDRRQPLVKLTLAEDAASAGQAVATRKVKIKVEVTAAPPDAEHTAGSGARDVRLFRNGSLIKAWRGDVLGSQTTVALEETISIVAGENNLTAYAFNKENIKSADTNLVVRGSASLKRKGTAYVLIVGINEYSNSGYNLKYAVADAKTFGETLEQTQNKLGNYSRVEIIPLLDQSATRANILAALNLLSGRAGELTAAMPAVLSQIKPAQPEDAVIVYFAGHGTAQKDRFYLIPHDLGYEGPPDRLDETGLGVLLAHSISDQELEQAFEHIDAGDLLMVIDACNSGQALESEERRRGPMNSKGLAQLAYEKGIYILTAAQAYQAALEAAELGHGYLTYALVEEGLKTAAADTSPRDETVLIREWLDYAVERVPQMQAAALQAAAQGGRGLKIVFVQGEEKVSDPLKRNVQRPRVFYRREMKPQPLVVERISGKGR